MTNVVQIGAGAGIIRIVKVMIDEIERVEAERQGQDMIFQFWANAHVAVWREMLREIQVRIPTLVEYPPAVRAQASAMISRYFSDKPQAAS